MKKLVASLIGSPAAFSFEQRIFHFAILLGVVLSAVGTGLDVFYGITPVWDIIFTCLWISAYYFARYRDRFRAASAVAFTVMVFVFLPYQWVMNGGIVSPISFYPIVLLAVVCIVLSGRFRTLMSGATLGVILLLLAWESRRFGSLTTSVPRQVVLLDACVHLLIAMAAIAVLITVYSHTYMREKARSEAYAKALEQNYHQQLYYMETLEGLIDRLKSERHDFNNHLGVMYSLLTDGESEKAKAYSATLVQAASEYHSIVNIPYSMLRAMLNYKLSIAKERGISLNLEVGLPEGLSLEEADLTVMMGNLLDNAIEACDAVTSDMRRIGLSILCKRDYLVIQTENPIVTNPGAVGGKGRTTKRDKENHGFGLRNIEYLVHKHNGLMQLDSRDGVFRVSIALMIPSASE